MKEIQKYIEKYWLLFVLGLLILGFSVRWLVPLDISSFGYDQARDAQRIYDMVYLHHLKLVGPETDIPGVFNGPLLYYLLLPVYVAFHFNPIAAVALFIGINLLTGLLVYSTGRVLFKNVWVSVLAVVFWIFSFDQISFSHYISNASLMGLGSVLFFLGSSLYFIKGKTYGLFISILGLGIAIQSNFYLAYLILFYILFFYLYPRKLNLKVIIWNIILLFVLLSPFIIAELKWHFMMTRSFLSYVGTQGGLHALTGSITAYVNKIGEAIYYSFFSLNLFVGVLLILGLIVAAYITSKEKKELLYVMIWSFSTLSLFGFSSGVFSVHVINLTILPGMTLLVSYAVLNILQQKKYLWLGVFFLLLMIVGNMKLLIGSNYTSKTIVMSYAQEEQVIDYTYQQAQGKPFSICAVSDPLFINTVWSYLYDHYGLPKYHYLPFWAGQQQNANTNMLTYDSAHTSLRFLILESFGIPDASIETSVFAEDHVSRLLQTQRFGEFTIEKRILQKEPRIFMDTQSLTPQEASHAAYLLGIEPLFSCYNTYTQAQ